MITIALCFARFLQLILGASNLIIMSCSVVDMTLDTPKISCQKYPKLRALVISDYTLIRQSIS